MSNPNPPDAGAPMPRWFRWAAGLALAGYAVFLAGNTAVVAGGSDSSGYLNSARLLASGHLVTALRVPAEFGPIGALDPMHFTPQGFFAHQQNHALLTPTYPTGLPLHFAIAAKLLGWTAGPLLIMLGAALAALWLCYAMARELRVGGPLALAGAAMLAAFPVFIFTSIQPLSDTLATTWTLAALWCGLRARPSAGWAAACGAAFGLAVLVRPTNVVLAPALLVLLGLHWRKLLVFVATGAPAAAWLAFYNQRLYGGAFQSGYGDILAAFGWFYGAPTALHFAKWLALLLPTPILVLALVAGRRDASPGRERLGLTLCFATITGLYAFYEVSHEVWWCLRFILPAVPALLMLALLGVESLAKNSPRGRAVAAMALSAWALAAAAYWTPRLDVYRMKHYENAYADGARAARDRFAPNALVLSFAFSGSIYFYSDLNVLRWDQLEPPVFARYAALAETVRRPVCALLFDWEEQEAFRRCPGEWTRLGTVRNVGLWQLAPPKT